MLLALLAQVGAPRPDRDEHVDRRVEREEAHLAVAAEGDRADVAAAQLVRPDQLVRRLAQLLERVGQLHVVELGRAVQAVEVVRWRKTAVPRSVS